MRTHTPPGMSARQRHSLIVLVLLSITLCAFSYLYFILHKQENMHASLISVNGIETSLYNIERQIDNYYHSSDDDAASVLQRQLLSLTTEADYYLSDYLNFTSDNTANSAVVKFSRSDISQSAFSDYRDSLAEKDVNTQLVGLLNLLRAVVHAPSQDVQRLLTEELPLSAIIARLQAHEQALLKREYSTKRHLQTALGVTLVTVCLGIISYWLLVTSRLFKSTNGNKANGLAATYHQTNEEVYTNLDSGKMKFLSLMSHEFRAPISAIITALELMPNMKENQQGKLIQQAELSCYRLLNLTNNLLDILSDDAPETIAHTEIDLISLLDECISPISVQVKNNQVEFGMHCSHSVPQYIEGDAVLISNVLKNVLDNAVKFTDNGLIDISITTQVKDKKVYLVVKVVDSGVGMDENAKKQIFNRFYRGAHPHNQRYPGAGIGLAVVKKSLERLDGTIEVNSEPGLGSEFIIHIPISPITAASEPKNQISGARFAIVDDLEISRLHIQNIISNEGYTSRCFASGSDLLQLRDELLQFTAIFIDLYMPGMNGLELVRTLNAIYGERTPPIIVLSATPDIANIIAGSEVEVWQSFVKPIDRNRIIDTLRHLVHPRDFAGENVTKARILIVEDEPINAELVENMMQCMGHIPTTVNSGEEAIIAAKESRFHAVLLDINLQDMSGLEVAKILKEQWPDLPIIALTANAHRRDKEESAEAGIRYHLVKPVTFQELKNTLRLSLFNPNAR